MKSANALLLLAFCLSSCGTPASNVAPPITKVSISIGLGPDSLCLAAFEVDSSLAYRCYFTRDSLFFGNVAPMMRGHFTGNFTQAQWDTLTFLLQQSRFQQLGSVYDPEEFRMPGAPVEILISYQGGKKRFTGFRQFFPPKLARLQQWLADSYRQVALTPSPDSIIFATDGHYMAPPPPPPRLEAIKFKRP